MLFDDINWHDGQIKRMCVLLSNAETGGYNLELDISYYQSAAARERMTATLQFEAVKEMNFVCDFDELKDNFHAGNISNGYVKEGRSYRIYLVDGYLDICAQDVRILA